MSNKNLTEKKLRKTIAKKRINKLFELAEENALSDKLILANRYVEIARKISMRHLVPIPKEHKIRFCKHCYSYLLPNVNSRVRINAGKIVIYCNNCKKYTRIPLKNNKKESSAILK